MAYGYRNPNKSSRPIGPNAMPRRMAVTGGRDFDDEAMVRRAFYLVGMRSKDVVVHGGCSGADRLCARMAKTYGCHVDCFHANWDEYGKAAGPIRNREMLESGVDLLIAFPGGRGTANCVETARELGIPVLEAR